MKIRWREHEAVLISMTAVILISRYITEAVRLWSSTVHNNTSAHVQIFSAVLLPQIGTIALLWLCYRWVNCLVALATNRKSGSWFKYAVVALQLVLISYIIGPMVNIASFYIDSPYHTSPLDLPLVFGFHPQPLINLFGGWDVAISILLLYLLYALCREAILYWYSRMDGGKDYAIQVSNQVTAFLTVFFTAKVFLSAFNLITDLRYFHFFNAFILPVGAVFMTNKYWLLPLKGQRSFFTWQVTGPILLMTFTYTFLFSIFLEDDWNWGWLILNWALQLFVVTPASWLDYQQHKNQISELRGMQKALVKSRADLQLLRTQINPHFLFNILNTLYGTALIESSPHTADGIQRLGDMMRFMLHENVQDDIAMAKEIEYLKNYIYLQKLRTQLSSEVVIEDDIAAEGCHYRIAPMLLIPLVENAFKHGINLSEKSWIKIHLSCADHALNFEVRNSLHLILENDPEKEHSGIGLQNVQSRLKLLYADKFRFTYGIQANEYVASLILQF